MNQSRYIKKILSKFGMSDCKPRSTPCKMYITKTSNKVDLIYNKPYQEIIGSLIYIMVATRPDICYIGTRLSQDLVKLNFFHLTKAKHILHYLKGTINHSLIFKKFQKPLKLAGFCDIDWANLSDRKSVSGFCFRLAKANPMISWKSQKQNSVALTTCEAEFIAISLASQEALYLRVLLRTVTELESLKHATTIYSDNQSSIVLAKNSVIHQRSKHSVIKFQFICDEIN